MMQVKGRVVGVKLTLQKKLPLKSPALLGCNKLY